MALFVTIEGIEGSGKSTLQNKLAEYFRAELGRQTSTTKHTFSEVVITREPGATLLGQSIRNIVLNRENAEISAMAELLLFAADRAQHLEDVVRPALERGALVLCDRFIHSTLAYQGYGRGIDLDPLRKLNAFICGKTLPDLVLLLDLPPEKGLERAAKRSQKDWTHFEQQALDFHQRVRDGFLQLAKDSSERFSIIDASQNENRIAELAIKAIEALGHRG